MLYFSDSEPADAEERVAPTLMVSMIDDHLVIRPPDVLDLEMTEVLVVAAASAVSSGSTVMIDLDPDTASNDLIARRPLSAAPSPCIAGENGPVGIPRAGYVCLRTRDARWTIDLIHRRLCRSEHAVDPQFVRADDWTPIQALWVTPTEVTALTTARTYLSTRTAWTIERTTGHLASA